MTSVTANLFSIGVYADYFVNNTLRFFILPPVNTTAYKTTLYRLSVYVIVFISEYFNRATFAAWSVDTWRIVDPTTTAPGTQTYANTTVFDQSTIVGLRWFSFSGLNKWDMSVTFTNNLQLDFTTTNSNISFGFDLLVMQTYWCANTIPYLNGSTCLASCPAGLYQNEQLLSCFVCISNCAACPSTTTCTTCSTGYYLQSSTQCTICTTNCSTCANGTTCTTCTNTTYLNPNDNLCYSTCPTTYFPNTTDNTCASCVSNCDACSNNSACTTCSSGFFLSNSLCVATCPTTFFGNTTTRACEACGSNCDTCTSNTVCTVCTSPNLLNPVDSSCVATCPTNYTYDLNATNCGACPTGCLTCNGTAYCGSCDTGYVNVSNLCEVTQTTSPSTKFLAAGVVTATIPTTAWTQLSYSVPFTENIAATATKSTMLVLNTFDMTNSNGVMAFNAGITSTSSTGLGMSISSRVSGQINAVGLRYLVLTDNYAADNVNMVINNIVISGSLSISSTNPATSSVTFTNFNLSGGVSTFVSIVGMDTTSSSTAHVFDLGSSVSNSGTTFTFTVTSTNSVPTTLASITLQYIIYNTGHFNRANFASFSAGSIAGSATPTGARLLQGPIGLTGNNVNQNTTIVGMSNFAINGGSGLNYNTQFVGNSFSVASTTPNNAFTFNYVLMPTYACNVTNPYYIINQTSCVATCPNPSYANNATLTCDACPTGCSACTSLTACSACTSGYFLRADNLCYTTCPSGYVENNVSNTCDTCSTGCSVCTNGSHCTSCFEFYRLNTTTNACDSCPSNCRTCSSATVCTSCAVDY